MDNNSPSDILSTNTTDCESQSADTISSPSMPLSSSKSSNDDNSSTLKKYLKIATISSSIICIGYILYKTQNVQRVVSFLFIPIGAITFIPNVMMSDSGSWRATLAAMTGMGASGLMVLGGILGVAFNNLWYVIPGIGCQICAFGFLCF